MSPDLSSWPRPFHQQMCGKHDGKAPWCNCKHWLTYGHSTCFLRLLARPACTPLSTGKELLREARICAKLLTCPKGTAHSLNRALNSRQVLAASVRVKWFPRVGRSLRQVRNTSHDIHVTSPNVCSLSVAVANSNGRTSETELP